MNEIIKSINSQKNNKSLGSDALTAEFYKYFSNELAPVLLDVYDSWGKLGSMGVTCRTGIESVIYKRDDKNHNASYRPIYYNFEESTAKNIRYNNRREKIRCY